MTTARVGVDITASDKTSSAFMSAISNINKLNTATKTFGDRQRNMAFQMNDVFTQLSTGTSPLLVMMQQGPQIAQIYGFGNGGVAAAFRDVGAMIWTITKRVGPFALVAGAAAAGLTREVNRISGETYTMGEVFSATMDVVSQSITEKLMPVIKSVEPETNSVLDAVTGKAKGFGNLMIQVNVAWFETVKRVLSEIPDLFRYAGAAAANFFVQKIENMINTVARLLNMLSSGLNKMFDNLPEDMRPGKIGMIGKWTLPKFDAEALGKNLSNPFQGLGTDVGRIFATDYIGGFVEKISGQAAKNRIRDAAQKSLKPNSQVIRKGGADDVSSRYNEFNHPLYGSNWSDAADGLKMFTESAEQSISPLQQVSDLLQNRLGSTLDAIADRTLKVGKAFKNMALGILQDAGKMMLNSAVSGLFRPENALYGGGGGLMTSLLGGLFNSLPSFSVGADRVPNDMVAKIHEGEMIVPKAGADYLRRGGASGGGGVTIIDQRSNAPAIEQSTDSYGNIQLIVRDQIRKQLPSAMNEARSRSKL
jgi:hypothetical protein